MQDIKNAISKISQLRIDLDNILKDKEDLQLRSKNVLISLENGMKNLAGLKTDEDFKKTFTPTPLTNVTGIAIKEKSTEHTNINPTEDEKTKLRREAEAAYLDFTERSNESIYESVEDLTIRAVARKAGIHVTSTDPVKITIEFIQQIKEAIANKEKVNKTKKATPRKKRNEAQV